MAEPGRKRFEKQVQQIHRQLAPKGAKIAHDERIIGFDSKIERQVKTTIRYSVGHYDMLLIVDCKDYSDPIDVDIITSFKSLAKDVRANKAVMISASGYTAPAIEMARSAGIEARTSLDTEHSEWHSDISIPALISGIGIDSWNVRFSPVPGHLFGIPSHPQQVAFPLIETIAPDGTPLGPILVLLREKWRQDESLQVPGQHAFNLAEHVVIRDGANEFHSRIDVEIRVVRRHYFGPVGVSLQSFREGSITNEMKTDFIDPERIERGEVPGWVEIPNKDELAVSVMLRMGYVNALPETGGGVLQGA